MNTAHIAAHRAISNLYGALADLHRRCDEEALFPLALEAVEVETTRLAEIADTLRGKDDLKIALEASRAITAAQATLRYFASKG